MFQDSPIFSIFSLAIAVWLFSMWIGDYKYFVKNGEKRKGCFAGATPAPLRLVIAGVVAALAFLALSVFVEAKFGLSAEQTKVAPWALFSWIGAAFVEELVFRGYLVVQGRGRTALWGGVFFFSFLFAAGHPFLWNYEVPDGSSIFSGVWTFNAGVQPLLSTLTIFGCSLIFYVLRFVPQNIHRSIMPCICAHAAYNCGVFAVKLCQGFVEW